MKKNLFITLSFIACIIPMMIIDILFYFRERWLFCKRQIEKKAKVKNDND